MIVPWIMRLWIKYYYCYIFFYCFIVLLFPEIGRVHLFVDHDCVGHPLQRSLFKTHRKPHSSPQGFMGPNYSIATACATANYCFHDAANHIRSGRADVMVAGGTEASVCPVGLGGFVACRALSKNNDNFQTASRAWDKTRDGFVMGEGAGVLVLESEEHAKVCHPSYWYFLLVPLRQASIS